jgi:uncharacterized membrane protein
MQNNKISIKTPGHLAFALVIITLGIMGLLKGNFVPVWEPVPKWVPAREVLAYLCAFVCLTTGVGLLWQRAIAARVLLAWSLLWLLVFRLPEVFPAPAVVGNWFGVTELAVTIAGAWVLYVWFANTWDKRHLPFVCGKQGLRTARVLYGASLIHFGFAHFVYLNMTTPLVPAYLGWPEAWAYFTGGAYIAAGIAILVGVAARLAATLSAWQIGLFTLLVWGPKVATNTLNDFQVTETVVSIALTTAAWVVAESYRDMPWLAVNKR